MFFLHHGPDRAARIDIRRRPGSQTPTRPLRRSHGSDCRRLCAGDAAMTLDERLHPGAGGEDCNGESGQVWLERARAQGPHAARIAPVPEKFREQAGTVTLIRGIFDGRMVPMTGDGPGRAMRKVAR
ncbi:MAG: hypothetical protein IOC80_01820 [Rhodobacter sp.]|nr:hypothetical protein [Rhodobacter sp.]MCA3511749.1 hypothetical protein [Rhodobacter sp.]MCA3522210.1 hypothetical protein [Rhodobacter sp.]MCA3525199.1 hypothetical protein [Rhodobacter sp.]MCA3530311.1 hypothetical protein [Rhodobacter sp.]